MLGIWEIPRQTVADPGCTRRRERQRQRREGGGGNQSQGSAAGQSNRRKFHLCFKQLVMEYCLKEEDEPSNDQVKLLIASVFRDTLFWHFWQYFSVKLACYPDFNRVCPHLTTTTWKFYVRVVLSSEMKFDVVVVKCERSVAQQNVKQRDIMTLTTNEHNVWQTSRQTDRQTDSQSKSFIFSKKKVFSLVNINLIIKARWIFYLYKIYTIS